MIEKINYNRKTAVDYALKYAYNPNSKYPYYDGNDCTNFVSQCLKAGGGKNDFNKTHPWWCVNKSTSICWSVAHSLYWYIKVSTQKNFGIIADSIEITGDEKFNSKISHMLELGDIIQYYNYKGNVQHSAIITGFTNTSNGRTPLISQHTHSAVNIPWSKGFNRTIFHHIKLFRYDTNQL